MTVCRIRGILSVWHITRGRDLSGNIAGTLRALGKPIRHSVLFQIGYPESGGRHRSGVDF